MSQQEAPTQQSKMIDPASARAHGDDASCHDSDDEPMVYTIPKDYTTLARQERDSLLAEGVDPDSIILMSALHDHVPQKENDPVSEYTKPYANNLMDLTRRGFRILNDKITAEALPDTFQTASGNVF